MSDVDREVTVSRFIGDAASWSALGIIGADLFRELLSIGLAKDDVDLIGAIIGLVIAVGFAMRPWKHGQHDFGQLKRYLFETNAMFILGLLDEQEYSRLRQNCIEHFG